VGKPITEEGMMKHVPNSIQCPFCLKTTPVSELNVYEAVLYDGKKISYARKEYHCSCGGQIMKATASD